MQNEILVKSRPASLFPIFIGIALVLGIPTLIVVMAAILIQLGVL